MGIVLGGPWIPPSISTIPDISFDEGVAGSVDLSQYVTQHLPSGATDAETVYDLGSLGTGLSISGSNLVYDGFGGASAASKSLTVTDSGGQATSAAFNLAVVTLSSAINLTAKRYDGGSGLSTFSGTVPLQQGQLTPAGLGNVALLDTGVQIPISVTDTDLRHPDGSVKVIKVDTELSAANEVEVPLTLQLGVTPTAGTVTPVTIDQAWMGSPRLLGCTDADHLCRSHVALGPLVPLATIQSQGLTEWTRVLTTQWDSSDANFPCFGNPVDDFLAGNPASWPGQDTAASYNPVYPMYCKYIMSGDIDDLRLANGFVAWNEMGPYNISGMVHGNGTITRQVGGATITTDPEFGASGSPQALAEQFSGWHRDVYMGWALGGWETSKLAGWAIGIRMKAERDVWTSGTPWAGRFDFRLIRECTNYAPLYRIDEDVNYFSGAATSAESPVTNWAWWQNMFQTQYYDTFETWATAISGDSLGRDGIWGWNTTMLTNVFPLFQFCTVFNTIYTLERNTYQDSQGRTWDRLADTADWCLGRTSFPTKHTFTFGPSAGVETYTAPYSAATAVPPDLSSGADGPYTCSMLMPMMAWAYAYHRDNGNTVEEAKYLEFIDTMNDNRCWVVNDLGTAGNGFKQIGEMYSMLPHAAAWRAGVAHDGWDLTSSYSEIPHLDAVREMAYGGITSVAATTASPSGAPSDSRKIGTGTIWDGSSLLHRLAARGSVDTGTTRWRYAFNGEKTGLHYDNTLKRNTNYVKWECASIGNDFFVCTTPGATAASAPSFDTAIKEVSTTNDGTVVWTYCGNVVDDHSGNSTGWDDTGNQTHDLFMHETLNSYDAYFYDLAGTALAWREYLIDRGLGTQADIDYLDWCAGLMIDHEYERNEPPQYRNRSNTYGRIQHQITTVSQGWRLDHLASGTRYKSRGLTDTTDMQGIAVTGQFCGANSIGSDADLSTITNWNFNEADYNGANVTSESFIREMSYCFRNWIAFKRCEFEDTGTLTWPTITVTSQISTPVPLPQFFISLLFEHWHKAMNGIEETSNGWAPFMKGLSSKAIIEYAQLMEDAGLDPNTHVNDAALGGGYTFTWSDSSAHGICQPWDSIASAFQDFFYWMRYTSTSEFIGGLMWSDSLKGWRLRSNENSPYAPELNGLIAPAYYYTAKLVKSGASVVPGTHSVWTDWLTDADEIFEGGVEGYTWFGTGKQTLEFLSYIPDTIDIRNEITGRKD